MPEEEDTCYMRRRIHIDSILVRQVVPYACHKFSKVVTNSQKSSQILKSRQKFSVSGLVTFTIYIKALLRVLRTCAVCGQGEHILKKSCIK